MLAILHGRVHSLERVANSRRRGMKVKVQSGVAELKRVPFAPRPRSRIHREYVACASRSEYAAQALARRALAAPGQRAFGAAAVALPPRRPHARRRHCPRAKRSSRRRSSQRQRDQRFLSRLVWFGRRRFWYEDSNRDFEGQLCPRSRGILCEKHSGSRVAEHAASIDRTEDRTRERETFVHGRFDFRRLCANSMK